MDNVTHALAGALLATTTVALVERRARPSPAGLRGAAAFIGIVTAELPDIDVLYAIPMQRMGKLGPLLQHRGYTHTIIFALVSALMVWGVALAIRKPLRDDQRRWSLLALALAGTMSHISLDYTNNYGVHPFWPLENSWYYGDAVFIVEPWLWIAAVPPLLFLIRNRLAQIVLSIALAGILLAAWRVDMVERSVALALTFGTVIWFVLVRRAQSERRWMYGLVAWFGVEAVFFAASHVARSAVRDALNVTTLRDVVLTPDIGNPLCFRALAVQVDSTTYEVAAATVAPFPLVRAAPACAQGNSAGDSALASTHVTTRSVIWNERWRASRAEFVALIAGNCEIAGAMRFMRAPFWWRQPNDIIRISDLRYGAGGGGFASIDTPLHRANCPVLFPPWNPPRSELTGPISR